MIAFERPLPWGTGYGRVWSLWEMLEFNAQAFHQATTALATISAWVHAAKDQSQFTHKENTASYSHHISNTLDDLAVHLEVLDANITLMALQDARTGLGSPEVTWGIVQKGIDDIALTLSRELNSTMLLSLNTKEQSLFQPKKPLFGNDVDQKFPSEAAFEIDEAAKCLALGRPTAAVFHLMRTMEIGVRATARCLQIPDPVKPSDRNWGKILEAIKAGITKKWPTTANRIGDGDLFEDLHASIDAVRNPWRNATMHVEKKYTDDEAEHIFVAVKGFMKKLASRCDEEGEPKAL